jgi:2-C-methyl-D-erythritol 4-phosphate cytidylyltransferase
MALATMAAGVGACGRVMRRSIRGKEFTDDASVAEAAGFKIFLSEGNQENLKITTPSDLIIAEALLKMV